MSADENLGRVLGAYRITGVVAEGSTGRVYRAQHTQLDRPAALKILIDDDDELSARFEREAKAAARIQDPHVAQVFELGSSDGTRYLAQELVEGESLAERLARGPLERDDWLSLGIGLAAGLAAIHRAGLVHRDLKPANVLLDGRGAPKIVDFGLVRDRRDAKHLTQRGVLLGTPLYMAPEQVAGASDVGPEADVFALGCVLHEALVGRVPHDVGDRDLGAFLARRAEAAAELDGGLDPDLSPALRGLLARDPAARPPAIAAQRALSDLRRRGRSPTAHAQPAARSGARVWLPVGLGAMLLAGAVGGIALSPEESPPQVMSSAPPPESTSTPKQEAPRPTRAPTPTPTQPSPPPRPSPPPSPDDSLRAGLAALTRLELGAASLALQGAPEGAETTAARALLRVLRAVNADASIPEVPGTREPFLRSLEAPRTYAVLEGLGGPHALGFYRRARRAVEQRRPVALWLAFRGYGVALRLQGHAKPPPDAGRFLVPKRRGELAALLLLGRAAERARRFPGQARADLDRVLAPPLGSTPLVSREQAWLTAWRDRLRAREK